MVSSFQDMRMQTFSCWYFLASGARDWEREMVCASLMGSCYKTQTTEGLSKANACEFEASPAVSPWKVLISWRRGCVQECGGTWPGCRTCLIHLQAIQSIWVCGITPRISLKDADFQKCCAPTPPKQGSFMLSPLNRGLLGKGSWWLQRKHQCWGSVREAQHLLSVAWKHSCCLHPCPESCIDFSSSLGQITASVD